MREICQQFGTWGIPTVDCLLDYQKTGIKGNIIASGGIRSGLDVYKSLALGAKLAGMALPMIKAADKGLDYLRRTIEAYLVELRVAMFTSGVQSLDDITTSRITIKE